MAKKMMMGDKEMNDTMSRGKAKPNAKAKLGIGRKKYGAMKMAQMAAKKNPNIRVVK